MKQTLLPFCVLLTSLAFGQITIGTGTNVDSNSGLCTPVSNFYSTSLSQFIYLASEINAQPGTITGFKFYLNSTSVLTNSDGMIDVWIGHTSRTSYNPVVSSTGADWIPISTHTQVLTNGTFVQTGNLVTVTFNNPFSYNGTDNLVITVDANEPNSNEISVLYYQTAASNSVVSLMFRTDSTFQNPVPLNPPLKFTGTVDPTSTQAKFTRPIITIEGLTTLGLNNNLTENKLYIYPNPVGDNLFIDTSDKINQITLYDSIGKLVEIIKYLNSSIPTDKLTNGVYFLKIEMEDDKILYKKFIKK
jgi:hypothetical protein